MAPPRSGTPLPPILRWRRKEPQRRSAIVRRKPAIPSVNLSVSPEIIRIDPPGSAGRLILPPPAETALGLRLAACGGSRLARVFEPAGPLRVRAILIIIGTSPVLPVTP